jgi:hypothetical protein
VDVVVDGVTGMLDEDLGAAALRCLALDPTRCREHALQYSWEACTRQFLAALVTVHGRPEATRVAAGSR